MVQAIRPHFILKLVNLFWMGGGWFYFEAKSYLTLQLGDNP